MSDYVIITDSASDLPQALVDEMGVHVVPLTVNYRGGHFADYPDNRELDPAEFYAGVRSGELPSTSAVSVGQWTDEMTPFLKAGKDILVLAFSSGLSTTYQSAVIAASDLAAEYPERKVLVVDTLCASLGQGLLVWYAVQKKNAGEDILSVRDYVENNKLHLCHWFTVDDLNHLKRGGRVSAATALVGTLLGIKPVMHVDNEGHLINVGKARGRKASIQAMVDHMAQTAIAPAGQTIFISHGDCLDDAEYLADLCRQRFGLKDVVINYVGPVIGAHSGPGTLALFFMGTER